MSQHEFSPDAAGELSPQAWYQQAIQQKGFIRDEAQAAAIEQLDGLWQQLVEFKKRRNRFLGRSLLKPAVPQGLYLWGGVGRGKSFLMDAFFSCVPYTRKKRVHFHHFMADVHKELKKLAAEKDPLIALAERMARATRLLCFDEFHVSDIADAMLLGRLLEALFARGVIMVMTSNYAPDNLYPNGLQRQNFLPTITLLKQQLRVLNVDGGHDYRLRELVREPLFLVPDDASALARLDAMFTRISGGTALLSPQIEVLGRRIKSQQRTLGVIWFDFATLCGGPRAQTDYLEIAREYHTVFLSGIPKLGAAQSSEARRFTWLVDVFYDHRVKLVASSAVEPEDIYTEGVHAGEFFRTASRLTEMQSQTYLSLPHLVSEPTLSGVVET